METSNVLQFLEHVDSMTFAQGLAFIERTRRQVDRFEHLPREERQAMSPEDAAEIRRKCDELEADINRSLGRI